MPGQTWRAMASPSQGRGRDVEGFFSRRLFSKKRLGAGEIWRRPGTATPAKNLLMVGRASGPAILSLLLSALADEFFVAAGFTVKVPP